MRLNDPHSLAFAGILTEIADVDGEFELSPDRQIAERERFTRFQSKLRGEFRRRQAAASLQQVQALSAKIRQGFTPESLNQAIDSLRASLGVDRPELAICFRSLTERNEEDLDGMLADVLLLEQIAVQIGANGD